MNSNIEKKVIGCKFCGCDIDKSSAIITNNIINNDDFYFYFCDECNGLTSQDFDRSSLYERDEINTNFTPSNQVFFTRLKYAFIKFSLRKFINKDVKNKRVLDYGCGNGDLANICHEYGAISHAYDLQESRPLGLNQNIYYLNNKTYHAYDNKFDIIFMRHVLEHVPSPPEAIKNLYDRLLPNGRLIIEVPNLYSINRKLMGRYWTGYFSPYHETVFSITTFDKICTNMKIKYEIHKAEPFILGVFLMQLGIPRKLSRILSVIYYPFQLLISKIFRTSEAIICVIHKSD